MSRLLAAENFNGDIVRGLLLRQPDRIIIRVQDGELQAWFLARMASLHIPSDQLDAATVIANICTDRIATDRKPMVALDFECKASLIAGRRSYVSVLNERHIWHRRVST